MKASTASRVRASLKQRRVWRRRKRHRQCQSHVLLRYCAIAKLIASGSPYFVPQTLLKHNTDTYQYNPFDIFEKYVGGVNDCEIFL